MKNIEFHFSGFLQNADYSTYYQSLFSTLPVLKLLSRVEVYLKEEPIIGQMQSSLPKFDFSHDGRTGKVTIPFQIYYVSPNKMSNWHNPASVLESIRRQMFIANEKYNNEHPFGPIRVRPELEKYCDSQKVYLFAINNIPENLIIMFFDYFEETLLQIVEKNELNENEYFVAAIDVAKEYVLNYEREIQLGHGDAWALKIAKIALNEDYESAFTLTYREIKEKNKDFANRELEIYCKATNRSELFTKHFMYLIQQVVSFPDSINQASRYEKVYTDQINSGKDNLFAHHYADSIADGYSHNHSFEFAKAVADGIKSGLSEEQALRQAYRKTDD